jgi:hypothetical protein
MLAKARKRFFLKKEAKTFIYFTGNHKKSMTEGTSQRVRGLPPA